MSYLERLEQAAKIKHADTPADVSRDISTQPGGYLSDLDAQLTQQREQTSYTRNITALNERAEKLRTQADEMTGFGNMIRSTISGLPKAIKDLATSPLQSAAGAVSGLVKGATIGAVEIPIPDTREARSMQQGFEISGAFLPMSKAVNMGKWALNLTRPGSRLLQGATTGARAVRDASLFGTSSALVAGAYDPFDRDRKLEQRAVDALSAGGIGMAFGAASPYIGSAFRKTTDRFSRAMFGKRTGESVTIQVPNQPAIKTPVVGDPNLAYASKAKRSAIEKLGKDKGIPRSAMERLKSTFLSTPDTAYISNKEADNFLSILRKAQVHKGQIIPDDSASLYLRSFDETQVRNVGLIDYFLTPRLAFRRIGLGEETKPIFDGFLQMRDFISMKRADLSDAQRLAGVTRFSSIFRPRQTKEKSARIFRALNNPDDPVQLSYGEEKARRIIKRMMDELADRVDEGNHLVGKPPMSRKQNYITNLITDEGWHFLRKTGASPAEIKPALQRGLSDRVVNRLLRQRKGNLPIKEDVWESASTALRLHSKYSFLNPPISRFQKLNHLWGDKANKSTKDFIENRIGQFLGRPGKVETFLRDADQRIMDVISRTPGLRKHMSIQLKNGYSEMINVPRLSPDTPILGAVFPSKAMPSLKMLKYWSDLSFSVPYHVLNNTQYFQNVPPALRGGFITRYTNTAEGFIRGMVDFMRPSSWQKFRRFGLLSEISNLIEVNFGGSTGGASTLMNLFSKSSEFINRVSTYHATMANLRSLQKQKKLTRLVPELKSEFGNDFRQYAKHISDRTQFKFGIETKPAAFSNPVTDLWHQYNSFSLNQAEYIHGMLKNAHIKRMVPDLKKAMDEGRMVEYLSELTQGERGEAIRYITNSGLLISALGAMGGSFFNAIGRGMEPSFVEGTMEMLDGMAQGNADVFQRGALNVMIPPALQGPWRGDWQQLKPGRNFTRQMDMAAQLMSDEEQVTIMTGDGQRISRLLERNEALREIFFGTSRVPEFEERSRLFDSINKINNLYQEGIDDEWVLARDIIENNLRGTTEEERAGKVKNLIESGILSDSVAEKINTLLEEEVLGVGALERSFNNMRSNESKAYFLMQQKDEMTEQEFVDFYLELNKKGLISESLAEMMNSLLAELEDDHLPE